MVKQLIWKYLSKNTGNKKFQRVFHSGYRLALVGMNYGRGGTYSESGELYVLKMVAEKYKGKGPFVVFDVGANVGEYAKTAAGIFGSEAIIHSFEPSQKCYSTFRETTKGLQNMISNNFGFSDVVSKQKLYSDEADSGLASLYHRNLDHYGINMDKFEEIELSTIDDYCAQNNIERIHFLKMDIEGHELSALKGAERMLKEDRVDMIQFEFGGCNIDSRTFFQDFFYLLNGKYKIHRILRDGLIEVPTYNESHEIFMTINYLAIRR